MSDASHQPSVVVHIGYSRTATTMHQRHIFPRLERVRYLGKPFADREAQAALWELACRENGAYDSAAVTERLLAVANMADSDKVSCILLSNELMTTPDALNITEVIDRLEKIFGPVKILITIREQFALFRSWLGNVLPKAAYGSLEAIIEQHSQFGDPKEARISCFDYYKCYDVVRQRVGEDRVLMLPFELIRTDAKSYSAFLGEFLGVPGDEVFQRLVSAPRENASIRPFEVSYLNFKKRFLTRKRYPNLDRVGGLFFRVTSLDQRRIERMMADLKIRVETEFAPRNVALRAALLDRLGVDIAKLGYRVQNKDMRQEGSGSL